MSVTVNTSGSQTATVGTEHTLATITTAGVYVLSVDCANMVAGDELELRIYGKTRSSDTERVIYYTSFAHAQGEPIKLSVPVPTPHDVKATLKQPAGTGRSFPWAIYAL